MKVTLNQLDVFAEVARHSSVTKAANALHRTQPAISIQLKELEQRCGFKLFDVIGKKVFLTAAGDKLLTICDSIQKKINEIPNLLNINAKELFGVFKISIVSTAQYFIPTLLGHFHQQHPNVEIKLTVTNRDTALERLQNNQDDLVILSQLPHLIKITAQPILDDHLVMIAPFKHHLAKGKKTKWREIANENFIAREAGSGTRMVMEKIFSQHKIVPKVSFELGSGEAVKQAVMSGMGISLVSKNSIEQELKLKKLAILDIQGLPTKHTWYAVYPKGKSLSPITQKFLELIYVADSCQYIPNANRRPLFLPN
jgi:DNA-binding transcriptional LysR family regulator